MQKNNLISLLDSVFPNANSFFTSPQRKSDGHEKWGDFVSKFYHVDCISKLSLLAFKLKFQKWCRKNFLIGGKEIIPFLYTNAPYASKRRLILFPIVKSESKEI